MVKTLSRITLIGLIVSVIPLGLVLAQSETKESKWSLDDPRAEAKSIVDNFLEAYYHNTTPEGMGLIGWIILVRKNFGWLRRIGDKRVVEPFIELLKDTVRFEELVKWEGMTRRKLDEDHSNIAIVLGRLGDKRAIPALKECLKWKSREMTRMEAAIALCFLGEAKVGLPVVEEYASRDTPPFNSWGDMVKAN
uniref:HEAT repeat domain-containing protein n=1 Tax=candidate division WOR-3 bacterium TaxID=2052148 RepID=A0A7C6AA14_UNCW3